MVQQEIKYCAEKHKVWCRIIGNIVQEIIKYGAEINMKSVAKNNLIVLINECKQLFRDPLAKCYKAPTLRISANSSQTVFV